MRARIVLLLLCAAAVPVWAQDTQPQTVSSEEIMGRAFGRLLVNGTPTESGATVFVDKNVEVPDAGHIGLVGVGNSLVFIPKSKFHTMHNAYRLESGGSKVATYSGMTAHLPNCYSVTPVQLDTLTQYEVNWSGNSAYVYARKRDVRINYSASGEPDRSRDVTDHHPNRDWIVKEGHWARIDDVKLCKPAVFLWPEPNLPTALELTGATGFFVSIPFWDMSSDRP